MTPGSGGIKWAGVVLAALLFVAGYYAGARWGMPARTVYECSGQRLVGTLFTDSDALAVPGKLVLAWSNTGNKKLIDRNLFEICATVEAGNGA